MGFLGPVETLNRGWSLEKFTTYLLEKYNQFENENIVQKFSILMDWDRKGDELQKKLMYMINSMDKNVDDLLRKELIRTLNGRTKTVEGMRFILDDLIELMSSFTHER